MKKKILIMSVLFFVAAAMLFANPVRRNEIVEFLHGSYSQRHFTNRPISNEIINQILRAGHQAGSAANSQPWHFTVIRNRALINDIMSNVVDENVLIVVSGPREHPRGLSVEFDTAIATQNMFLAAQALGLGARMFVRPIRNLNDNLLGRLNLPENYLAVMILLVGYESPDVDTRAAASPRQPLESKVNFIN
ncbi:MAG: nitroreductase family protein [Spirochaetaceae bacterium]|nr:nitroreductase family protein [Spirochaetaceae bacterium]